MGEPKPTSGLLKESGMQAVRIRGAIDAMRVPDLSRERRVQARRELYNLLFTGMGEKHYGDERFVQWSNLHFALGYLGLDSDATLTDWEKSFSSKKRNTTEGTGAINEIFVKNVKAVMSLEGQRPGSVGVLGKQFGIHNFYRYPPTESTLLVDQYDTRKDRTKPFVVAFVAQEDHNNAMSIAGERLAYLKNTLGEDFNLRIYEFNGRDGDYGLERTLLRARSRYGPQWEDGQQAPLGVLFTHGGRNFVRLAASLNHSLTKFDDVFRGRDDGPVDIQPVRGLFTDYATWVLGGCFTGVENGIGDNLASRFELRVIAPDNKSYLPVIAATNGPFGLDFVVAYEPGVETKTYDRNNIGQMITVFPERQETQSKLILPGDSRFRK